MLAKKYRLSKKRDIERVFQQGRIVWGKSLRMRYRVNNNAACPRFAFIVSNKISKKATVRTKIRRRLRAIVYKNLSQFSKNYDIIFIASPSIVGKKFPEIQDEVERLFQKARIFAKE